MTVFYNSNAITQNGETINVIDKQGNVIKTADFEGKIKIDDMVGRSLVFDKGIVFTRGDKDKNIILINT